MSELPVSARLYIASVAVVALGAIAAGPHAEIDVAVLVLLAVLFVLAESISTMVDGGRVGISPSSSVSLAAVVLVGPVGAAIVGMCAGAHIRRQQLVKRVFNAAQFALAGYAAGHVFLATGGQTGVPGTESFPYILVPFALAVVSHTLVNALLLAGLMWCLGAVGPSPRAVRWRPLARLELSSFGYGMVGLFIAAIWGVVGAFAVVLVLLPLFIARWGFQQYVAEQQAHDATLATLAQAVETKDYYTRGHCMRVARAARMIAQELGMSAERTQSIGYAGMLHDIGKLGVPTKVLQKAGPLTEEEFAAIQLHPMRGYEIVREIGFLDETLDGILHHHERMDGRGYPMGLAGTDIPESARIISTADVFDCITSTRAYRRARSVEEAIAELRRHAGTQFDPRMVEALITAVQREGWSTSDPVEPSTSDVFETAETTQQDHDDPGLPIVGERDA
ncbi:HD-GYP domain-containing protein [Lipingzhangella sp. LS1_29]|uniref:HD-GYP domain-containing protein n=1 Tax=Lipingzhangella rawalii TaxID=2055835 RepID=A0ABU2HB59_9ACTN|nr:HD-GYP domain-containing protein [Lipingzhangella rawalii]MDS1272070.1 HD-GYP domain-containing protein [Lipingzhangella rawalii]